MKVARWNVFVLVASLAWTGAAQAGLINPGFETGDFTGWSSFGQGWRIGTGADAQSGTYGAVNDILVTDVDEYRGIFQNLPASPGQEYSVSAWLRMVSIASGDTQGFLEVQFLNGSLSVLSQHQSPIFDFDTPYTQVFINHIVAPVGTQYIGVRGISRMVGGSPNDPPDFVIFDNFQIPEPTSAAAVLLGIGAMVMRRRRHGLVT